MKYYYNNNDKYAGFCAILNNAINVCKQYYDTYNNTDLYINISELNDIFNFETISNINNCIDYKPIWEKSNFDNSSNAHTIADKDKLFSKKIIYDIFFNLKNIDFYEKEVSKFINSKTLGIHIRGTDKYTEITPPENNTIINYVKTMLDKHNLNNIYLATDDRYYQDLISNEFGDIVKWRNKKISEDRNPIHFIEDRKNINIEVMTDVYLLSKCNYLLHCFSNVSYSALILGVSNFIDIKCLNIK